MRKTYITSYLGIQLKESVHCLNIYSDTQSVQAQRTNLRNAAVSVSGVFRSLLAQISEGWERRPPTTVCARVAELLPFRVV